MQPGRRRRRGGRLASGNEGAVGRRRAVPAALDALARELTDVGHGVRPVGLAAMSSLRLEKGYRDLGVDIDNTDNPLEAGLGFAVRLAKGDFLGRAALLRQKEAGTTRTLCAITLDDPDRVVMGKEPILDGDRVLGYVTSAAYGYTIGRGIAYGYLPISHAAQGTAVQIEFFGERLAATVAREPLYDPEGLRLKG